MRDESDSVLARRASLGDRQALEVLLDRHVDRIHAVCRRVVAHPEDALDATQEAMIAIARGIDRFDGRAAFSTWCYRVAVNACLDELRRRRRRPDPGLPEAEERPARGGQPDVDTSVADRMAIDAALAGLSPEFRAAVVLRDVCDLDYAEIAEVLDIPAGTVRSRIARGRVALIPFLAGNPSPPAQRPSERP